MPAENPSAVAFWENSLRLDAARENLVAGALSIYILS
jgi:hypothetical protein